MELKGKTVYFVGDSITQGSGASVRENSYVNVFAKNTGAKVVNYGVCGTRIAKHKDPDNCFAEYFRLRAEKIGDDADIIVVFGGTNDYGHGTALLGTMEDRTVDTFYGALHDLFYLLVSEHPQAQIVVLTPLHRLNEQKFAGEGSQNDKADLRVYVDVIREVAQYYSLPILDLFKVSGMQPAIPQIQQAFMTDGLHPNDAGHARLAKQLENFIKQL